MLLTRAFYFLRHGQTDWNREGRYQGHADIALNATGLAQAATAAEVVAGLKVDRIVTSPLIRALKTAAIIADRAAKPLHPDRGLMERSFGSFEGLIVADMKRQHGVPLEQSAPQILPADADPWTEIFDRAPKCVGKWLDTFPTETLLFVAHGGIFDGLHAHVAGPREGAESLNAVPYLFEPGPSGWSITPVA